MLLPSPLSSVPLRCPLSPLFPYPTLFRSPPGPLPQALARQGEADGGASRLGGDPSPVRPLQEPAVRVALHRRLSGPWLGEGDGRSEEHTSELQSRENLVCRLLLEKKKAEG